MIRKPIQFALVFILCPLLVAQQGTPAISPSDAQGSSQPEPEKRYLTLPGDTSIELLPPGPTTFAGEKLGAIVKFVVDKDVVLGGVPIIHAGVPTDGVVDYGKRGSHFRHRAAEMEIRVTGMVAGKPIELHLWCFDPGDPAAMSYSQPEPGPGFGPLIAGVVVVIVGLLLLALGGDR